MIQIPYILSKSLVGLYFPLRIPDVERTHPPNKENQINHPKALYILIYLSLYNILIEYLFKVILPPTAPTPQTKQIIIIALTKVHK